jgi:prophage regulatory protein
VTDTSRDNFLRLAEVMALTKMSRTTLYRRIAAGLFPRPIQIGEGLAASRKSELNAWMAAPMQWREVA